MSSTRSALYLICPGKAVMFIELQKATAPVIVQEHLMQGKALNRATAHKNLIGFIIASGTGLKHLSQTMAVSAVKKLQCKQLATFCYE